MEKIFMSAGILSAIVLCVVGILKLPFENFKKSHKNAYKATFTGVSIVLSVALCVLDQLYILRTPILSFDFAILLCAVTSGVSSTYLSYEGLGLKKLVNNLFVKVRELKATAKDKKVVAWLNRITDIDKAITILVERKNNGEV